MKLPPLTPNPPGLKPASNRQLWQLASKRRKQTISTVAGKSAIVGVIWKPGVMKKGLHKCVY